jgi:hypothetical protein
MPNLWGIASAGNGELFFTDPVDNRIGRFALAPAAAAQRTKPKR